MSLGWLIVFGWALLECVGGVWLCLWVCDYCALVGWLGLITTC